MSTLLENQNFYYRIFLPTLSLYLTILKSYYLLITFIQIYEYQFADYGNVIYASLEQLTGNEKDLTSYPSTRNYLFSTVSSVGICFRAGPQNDGMKGNVYSDENLFVIRHAVLI